MLRFSKVRRYRHDPYRGQVGITRYKVALAVDSEDQAQFAGSFVEKSDVEIAVFETVFGRDAQPRPIRAAAICLSPLSGKTTLTKMFPALFIDVDDLVSEDVRLPHLIVDEDWDRVNAIFREAISANLDRIEGKVLLCHHADQLPPDVVAVAALAPDFTLFDKATRALASAALSALSDTPVVIPHFANVSTVRVAAWLRQPYVRLRWDVLLQEVVNRATLLVAGRLHMVGPHRVAVTGEGAPFRCQLPIFVSGIHPFAATVTPEESEVSEDYRPELFPGESTIGFRSQTPAGQ